MKLGSFLYNNYYWIVFIGYMLSIFCLNFSIGLFTGVLFLLLAFYCFTDKTYKNKSNVLIFFVLLNIISLVHYIGNEKPIILLIKGLIYNTFPIVMYFLPKNALSKFYNNTFEAIFFSFVISIFLFLWAPSFYIDYLFKQYYVLHWNEHSIFYNSIQGLYGITMLGTFSACSFLFFYGKWLVSNNVSALFKAFLSILILIFAGRRSAIFATGLLFIIENIQFYNINLKVKFKQKILIAGTLLISLFSLALYYDILFPFILRIFSIPDAISERSSNWMLNINNLSMFDVLFGKGVGAAGHVASSMGYIGVHDCSYLLTFVELGFFGFIFFLLPLIYNLSKFMFIKKTKAFENYIAFYIVIIFLIQAIGSNVFEFPALASLFWFSLSAVQTNVTKYNSSLTNDKD